MLKARELAKVANKLEAPMVVSDIMGGQQKLTKDVNFALHNVISDMQPDAALLCIALCAKKIAGAHAKASPSLSVLEMECGRIVDDYAELWLTNAESGDVDEFEALDAISNITEDLESIAELLELNMSYVRDINGAAYALFNLLSIQARSHALVAEAFMEAIDDAVYAPPKAEIKPLVAGMETNNVISFPVIRKN
jgi:hypothetical protein